MARRECGAALRTWAGLLSCGPSEMGTLTMIYAPGCYVGREDERSD